MPSSTVEDYLKAIYLAQQKSPHKRVQMGKIAQAVDVVPGTATTMIKSLADRNLLEYMPRYGVRLTAAGERLAIGMVRRHRVVETFLVETLGLPGDEIHEEAEPLEHAISERVLEALDHFLGQPTHDPHGAPIPQADGTLAEPDLPDQPPMGGER